MRRILAPAIVATTVAVACTDFLTSAELVGAILFIVPLALCALQRSVRLLWGTAIAAGVLTIAAQFWGFGRVGPTELWPGLWNRGLLVGGLLTLTTFIHLWRNKVLQLDLDHRLLAAVFDGTTDPIYVRDLDSRFTLANTACAKLFRMTVPQIVGRNMRDLLPGNDFEMVAESDREIVRTDATRTVEEIAEIDGLTRTFLTTKSPYHDANRKTIGTIGIARDITARKDAEQELRQMESRYRGLLEAAPDAMVVVDAAGQIVLLNLQAEKKFGYLRDELVGQRITGIIPQGFAERLVADGTRSAADALAQQIGTGLQLIGRRKNGSEFPIEIMLSPLESPEGILVTAAIRDISVRQRAENHLRQMESRYRGLLEAAPDAMVVVDAAGQIVLLNLQAEKRFGYLRDELVGQRITGIIPQGFAERLVADGTRSAADALAQQIGTGLQLIGRRKDGSEFPIEIMLSPLESPEGILVTAAIRDISIRQKAEDNLEKTVGELKRSNNELEQFAYAASHDLQEPLRMVASFTELLAKRYKGRLDSEADDFIKYAVDGATRMRGLIQDLLTYSRAGVSSTAAVEISSERALGEALANLRTSVEESGAVVTHSALPVVTMHAAQLTQIFQNLIGNAIKYRGAEAPRIHVSSSRIGKDWNFAVRDNGVGIGSEYFERIFVLFQRLHGSELVKGSGIGLAVCKKVLERMGGRIWVESQSTIGSTFHFAFPARGS